MNIADELKSNFPNTINKGRPIFKALVANDEHTGVFETFLQDLKDFSDAWTESPNIYEQSGEMLELTSAFFTFLEKYTGETEEAFKKRIETIFVRNNDNQWGGPLDVKNVFKSYFPNANIFLVENVNDPKSELDETQNLIEDGDFTSREGAWTGISTDKTNVCHYDRDARFSKDYGVMIKAGGEFQQVFTLFKQDKWDFTQNTLYNVVKNDTFESISKQFYGTIEKADYIKSINPDVTELVPGTTINIPPLNIFFLHYFLNGASEIQLINNDEKYWNPEIKVINDKIQIGCWQDEEYTIFHDTIGKKYKIPVVFYRESAAGEIYIPKGTVVSDGIHNFITQSDDLIESGKVESYGVTAVAEKVGTSFKIPANTVNIIVSELENGIKVNNPEEADDGSDNSGQKAEVELNFSIDEPAEDLILIPIGTIVSDGVHKFQTINDGAITKGKTISSEITAQSIDFGYEYNVPANSINIVETEFSVPMSVNNKNEAGGGTDYGWENKSIYFVCDNTIDSVTIKIKGSEKITGLIDYFRLYKKQPYPSFSIVAHFENNVSKDAAALFPGTEDISITNKHENASYYDNDFLSGLTTGGYALDLYNDLLDYVRAVGVKAYIEIVNRDE